MVRVEIKFLREVSLKNKAEKELSSPVINDKEQLIETLSSGCKPKEDFRIGTEHEKFVFYEDSLKPVPYEGEKGIRSILEKLSDETGWDIIYEAKLPIGLKGDKASVSLEPGGQLELSGAPLENLHQSSDELHEHLRAVKKVCEPMGVSFLGAGFAPTWTRNEMPRMPKQRYNIMRRYLPKKGSLGLDMMHRTCTVQVNLDFSSEADMAKKFQASLSLQPLVTALFANSCLYESKASSYASYRAHTWEDTDPDRTGLLEFVFDQDFGFEKYVDYMLDVPMFFVKRGDLYLDASGLSFRDFMEGKLSILPGEKATLEDWESHLTTAFPEVRLKSFLEMRGADGGPWSNICALPALWVGLLYNEEALEDSLSLTKEWSFEDKEQLRKDAVKYGLKAKINKTSLQEIALELLEISKNGLKARAVSGLEKEDETKFLEPLFESAKSGVSLGEKVRDSFLGEFNGDKGKLFEKLKL
jgi:glutamate--cysteine ligase